MIKEVLTSLILFATIFVGELHNFWAGNETVQNWILFRPTPMPIEWNVKYLIQEVLPIMYFLAWIFYKDNPVNNAVIKSFLFLSVIDLAVYLVNFKTGEFGSIYFWFIAFFLLTLKRKQLASWLDKDSP